MLAVPTYEEFSRLEARVYSLEKSVSHNFSPGTPEYFTRNQAADYLGVSVRTIDNHIRSGRLATRRDGAKGGKVLVSLLSLRNLKLSTGYDPQYLESELKNFLANGN